MVLVKSAMLILTPRELEAVNGILAVVLNDPDWFFGSGGISDGPQDRLAAGRVFDKVQQRLRELRV